jgi:hypothetical protein
MKTKNIKAINAKVELNMRKTLTLKSPSYENTHLPNSINRLVYSGNNSGPNSRNQSNSKSNAI